MSPTCLLDPSDRAKFAMQRDMGILLLRCDKHSKTDCTLPMGHVGECGQCYRTKANGSDCFARRIPDIPERLLNVYSTLSCCM